jgi:hypothetical protein
VLLICFLAFSQDSLLTPHAVAQSSMPHLYYEVSGFVSNSDAWHMIYGVKPGDKVWISIAQGQAGFGSVIYFPDLTVCQQIDNSFDHSYNFTATIAGDYLLLVSCPFDSAYTVQSSHRISSADQTTSYKYSGSISSSEAWHIIYSVKQYDLVLLSISQGQAGFYSTIYYPDMTVCHEISNSFDHTYMFYANVAGDYLLRVSCPFSSTYTITSTHVLNGTSVPVTKNSPIPVTATPIITLTPAPLYSPLTATVPASTFQPSYNNMDLTPAIIIFLVLLIIPISVYTLKHNKKNNPQKPHPANAPLQSSIYCPLCGLENLTNARFCGRCGANLAPSVPQDDRTKIY